MILKVKQIGRPKIRPYGFKINRPGLTWGGTTSNNTDVLKVIEWILFNIGDIESNKWEFRGYASSFLNVYFSNEEDAIAFKLRWT